MRAGSRAAAAALGALLLGTACTGGGHAPPDPQPSGPGGVRTLRLATSADVTQGPVRQRLIEAWDERNPQVRVEIVKLPGAADNARSQLVAALQSDKAAYDVVNIDVAWTAEFAEAGLVRPLDDAPLDGMWEQVARTARYEDKTWAVPFNTDAGLLYYRKDIWKDEDWRPPETWAALDRAAQAARDESQAEPALPYGYVTQLDRYEGLTVNALESVWARGGELVGDQGEVKAGTARTEAGLGDLITRYRTVMPAEARDADERDSLELFREGKVAFMRNWPYVHNLLSAEGSEVKGDFGVAPLPGSGPGAPGASVLGGQNLAVTAGSPYVSDARALIAHLAEPAQQRCLLEAGFAPVLEESYEPDGAACSLPDADTGPAPGEGEEAADPLPEVDADGLPPYTGALEAALRTARPRPVTPYYAALTELVQTEVHPSLTGSTDGGTVATDLAEGLERVLEGR